MNSSFYRLLILIPFIWVLASCQPTQKIQDGETAFEVKQYAKAVQMLNEEYDKTRDREFRAYRAFLLAESYRHMGEPANASRWYQQAFDDGYGVIALERYGQTLKQQERYDDCLNVYTRLINDYGTTEEWEKEIRACLSAIEWSEAKEQNAYTLTNACFNSSAADYAPVFFSEHELLFTSDRASESGPSEPYWWTGRSYSGIFIYDDMKGEVEAFDEVFNSRGNDGAISFTQDGKEAFFTRCYAEDDLDAYCKIFRTTLEDRIWSEPEAMPFSEEGINEFQPAISPDGSILVFSSDKEGGQGGYDLYIVYRRGNEWTEPEPISTNINTPGNENFPGFHLDTLYFASDGLHGMGGLDIFRTVRNKSGGWSPAINLEAPINSGSDDFALVVNPYYQSDGEILQKGYLTSSRNGLDYSDDIFLYEKRKIEPVEVEIPLVKAKIRVKGKVLERYYNVEADPNSGGKGTRPLQGAKVTISTVDSVLQPNVDQKSRFKLELDAETRYLFLATSKGYLNNSYDLVTDQRPEPGEKDLVYVVDIVLDPLIKNTEITLENIYYDFNKSDIREDARPTLDELSKLLKLNPSINIQMGSHTDCRGTIVYNEDLSQRRAQSAVNYLIVAGVSAERLSAKGYGENEPAVDCLCEECTEEQHQTNRRTTFKILE